MTNEPLTLTADERALILTLREMEARADAIEVTRLRDRRQVWFSLIEARAIMYRDAIRHGMNDMADRQNKMLSLISPFDLIDLVQAWRELDARRRDDENAEAEAWAEEAETEGAT